MNPIRTQGEFWTRACRFQNWNFTGLDGNPDGGLGFGIGGIRAVKEFSAEPQTMDRKRATAASVEAHIAPVRLD